ncbi:MAG: T9SS type A sorting domain-containing protein [Bacteroidota bacterium]
MKYFMIFLFTCVWGFTRAQVNFVRNPDLEQYNKCPDDWNLIFEANYWSSIIDSAYKFGGEYYNSCSNIYSDVALHVPSNVGFYQYPHSDSGMVGLVLYNNKSSSPPSPLPFDYRDYMQGRLYEPLTNGKTYCVSFWVNMTEESAYGHNKIGAYLDNGAINKLPLPSGSEVTSVIPQVYTNDKIIDTANWVKIEGSFTANGTETFISIGNFFPNSAVDTVTTDYWIGSYQYSYYLVDDISVIPIDLNADAGKDNWVEIGKQIQIGRVGDTTAKGLDCKWYKKGVLIDSGAIITVNANTMKNAIDTYVVVQTICGLVKTDTVTVKTAGVGIPLQGGLRDGFAIYPNPSDGNITIIKSGNESVNLKGTVYDMLGRIVFQESIHFLANQVQVKIGIPQGNYILELKDESGNSYRQRILIQ